MLKPSPRHALIRLNPAMAALAGFALVAMTWLSACGPAEPVGNDDEAPGPGGQYVSRHVLTDVRGTLYLPSAVPFIRPSDGTALPWVVLIPGFASVTESYTRIASDLASYGFVVTALEHDFGFGSALVCQTQRDGFERIQASIDRLRETNRTTGVQSVLHHFSPRLFDETRLGTAGHSFGGKLALWSALDIEGVVAAFGLDPVDGGGDERRPAYCGDDDAGFAPVAPRLENLGDIPMVLIEAGLAGECAPEEGNATALFTAATDARALFRIPGAAHTDFVDAAGPDCGPACTLCPASEVEAEDVRTLSVETMAALFSARLIDRASTEAAVTRAVEAATAFDAEVDFLEIDSSVRPLAE